jgi:hypothetical protein
VDEQTINRLVAMGFNREYALSLDRAGLVTEEFTYHVELAHALVSILRDPNQQEKAAEIRRLLKAAK